VQETHDLRVVYYKISLLFACVTIFLGDFIQRWTNDIWHSPLHRVVTATIAPNHSANASLPDNTSVATASETLSTTNVVHNDGSGDAGRVARQSIVFFSGPLEHCVIECIDPALMKPEVVGDMRVRKYAPIRSGDHLMMKLNRTNNSTV